MWEGLGAPEGWCRFRILEIVGLPSWGVSFWATMLPKALGLSIEAQEFKGAWVAQSVKCLTSAQVVISLSCGFEPHVGLCG